jgi:hypothetical protein
MNMRNAMPILGFPLAGLVAAACATTSVRTDYDRKTEFERYQTYAIADGPLVREADVAPVSDRNVRNRIHGALAHELAANGLMPASRERPDIIVTYAVTARRDQELIETIGDDPNWNYGGNSLFAQDVERGTLVIDVIDADAGKLVWRSIATAQGEDVRSPEFIARAVDKAMQRFPPHADVGS